jgi:hypothetical protein
VASSICLPLAHARCYNNGVRRQGRHRPRERNIQVTEIEFDFFLDSGEEVSKEYKENLSNSYLNRVMEVEEEGDVADAISDETGWCVNHVDYIVI